VTLQERALRRGMRDDGAGRGGAACSPGAACREPNGVGTPVRRDVAVENVADGLVDVAFAMVGSGGGSWPCP
jgi:hypothetical protein